MSSSVLLCLDDCGYDCPELMMATSLITKPGVGGPLVNCYGEVVGVNFMNEQFTPFLAVNIVAKWLNLYDRYEKFCRPWTRLVVTNLYATSIKEMNRIVPNNPEVSRGVFVKRIHAGSPAHRVGLKPHDVIIQCNGREVKGFLEFYCKLLSKCGSCVEVGVVRKGHNGVLKFKIPVEQCDPNNLNKWPLPTEHSQRIVRGQRG
ncbi:Trypsin family protein with PDZ domain [Striga hermonthica]|uniref:Trypsin family protein with PDZ domain n=1 Tax=Striga hermonthica TaxID=68872 RepID=A0A9N7P2B1_STRHE|nr:Trypsin family protein with PDZ domain [Striga hermonthica]